MLFSGFIRNGRKHIYSLIENFGQRPNAKDHGDIDVKMSLK